MENKKKVKRKINIGATLGLTLITAITSAYVTFKNHDSLIKLNNLREYKVAEYSAQNPYEIMIEREVRNDSVFTYLKDDVTGKKLEIFRDLNVGTLDQRISSIWGNDQDKESIKYKINNFSNIFKIKSDKQKEGAHEYQKID